MKKAITYHEKRHDNISVQELLKEVPGQVAYGITKDSLPTVENIVRASFGSKPTAALAKFIESSATPIVDPGVRVEEITEDVARSLRLVSIKSEPTDPASYVSLEDFNGIMEDAMRRNSSESTEAEAEASTGSGSNSESASDSTKA